MKHLVTAGFTQRLTATNKTDAGIKIVIHEMIISRKSEIDQLASGLRPVLDLAIKYPDVLQPLLTASTPEPLTSNDFLDLFQFEDTIPTHQRVFCSICCKCRLEKNVIVVKKYTDDTKYSILIFTF